MLIENKTIQPLKLSAIKINRFIKKNLICHHSKWTNIIMILQAMKTQLKLKRKLLASQAKPWCINNNNKIIIMIIKLKKKTKKKIIPVRIERIIFILRATGTNKSKKRRFAAIAKDLNVLNCTVSALLHLKFAKVALAKVAIIDLNSKQWYKKLEMLSLKEIVVLLIWKLISQANLKLSMNLVLKVQNKRSTARDATAKWAIVKRSIASASN